MKYSTPPAVTVVESKRLCSVPDIDSVPGVQPP
jgi:hypothetical protein